MAYRRLWEGVRREAPAYLDVKGGRQGLVLATTARASVITHHDGYGGLPLPAWRGLESKSPLGGNPGGLGEEELEGCSGVESDCGRVEKQTSCKCS